MKLCVKTIYLFCLFALFLSSLSAQGGLINHPVKKTATKSAAPKPKPVAAKPAPPKVMMWGEANYKGESLTVNENLPVLPAPLGTTENGQHGKVSSLKVNSTGWVVFWEGKSFKESDDQLWVEGPAVISDLAQLHRPHGNNHWNDRILAVSFASAPPTGSNKNRTIITRKTNVR
ncbi:MAG: hypothetical protein JST84_15610 [Acidobacteria bacterium]|nr:hypothetical protein [Acidobacteriota bacterium]